MRRLFEGTPFDRPPRCERCGKLEEDCTCPDEAEEEAPVVPPGKQTARLRVERRRKGKVVTLVEGLVPRPAELTRLLTVLKSSCGAGGALKEGSLEIQGDHRDRVRGLLLDLGYRVKG